MAGPRAALVVLGSLSLLAVGSLLGVAASQEFTRSIDSSGNLDIYETKALLEGMETTIAVGIIIDNRTPYRLALEQQDLPCGRLAPNSSLPSLLSPGRAGLAVMEKKPTVLRGVCGALRYSVLSGRPSRPGPALLVMWSQPYDLNLYTAYSGAGLTSEPSPPGGLFSALYYSGGDWVRAEAGVGAVYSAGGIEVVANLTAGTYKPVVVVTVREAAHGHYSVAHSAEEALPLGAAPRAGAGKAAGPPAGLAVALLARLLS